MEINVAKNAGFCFGVNRAMDLALKALQKRERKVYSLGPLIHNPQAIEKLEKMGMKVVNSIDEIPEGVIFVIRSHGTTPEVIRAMKRKKATIIDATCPFVKNAQNTAEKFYKEGCQVVIVGDPNHAEVVGINARTKNTARVIQDVKQIKDIKNTKTGVVCQTTQKLPVFKKIVTSLMDKVNHLEVKNTICLDSQTKKEEVKRLAKESGVVIVVGGKNSSNTTKLAEISLTVNPKTYHIETANELKSSWFRGIKKIGITAGASTPDWVIGEVMKKLGEIE